MPMLAPELATDLSEARWALFIDADARLHPLTWTIQSIEPSQRRGILFAGHLEPSALLYLTHELYGRCPESYLFRIGANYFDFDDSLSAEMKRLVPQLAAEAQAFVSSWIGEAPGCRFEGIGVPR